MENEEDSKQQELPKWQIDAENPTPRDDNKHHSNNNNTSVVMASVAASESRCTRIRKKCGPIGWYFSPITDKIGYSLSTTFYHLFNFVLFLFVFIFMVTGFSVSIGLMITIVGFPLYWLFCECGISFARLDLAMTHYLVEDRKDIIESRLRRIQLSIYYHLSPCPCSRQASATSTLWMRIKTMVFCCDMYKIVLYQLLLKPIICNLTAWIFIVDLYFFAYIFAPIVYLIDPNLFTSGILCPFGGNSCNDGNCTCYGWKVNDFGMALLVGVSVFLAFPLVLHVSQWFAKANKFVTYLCLTRYYYSNPMIEQEERNLLSNNNKNNDNNNAKNNTIVQSNAPAIVHSVNNPYSNDV